MKRGEENWSLAMKELLRSFSGFVKKRKDLMGNDCKRREMISMQKRGDDKK